MEKDGRERDPWTGTEALETLGGIQSVKVQNIVL